MKTVTVRYIFAPFAGNRYAIVSSTDSGFELIKAVFIVGQGHDMSTTVCFLACLL